LGWELQYRRADGRQAAGHHGAEPFLPLIRMFTEHAGDTVDVFLSAGDQLEIDAGEVIVPRLPFAAEAGLPPSRSEIARLKGTEHTQRGARNQIRGPVPDQNRLFHDTGTAGCVVGPAEGSPRRAVPASQTSPRVVASFFETLLSERQQRDQTIEVDTFKILLGQLQPAISR